MIVDDHLLVRQGLAICLGREPGLEVVGGAGDSDEALGLVGEQSPDVVLMDIALGAESGLDLTRRLKRSHPGSRILALTSITDDDVVSEMLQAGADGYVLKGMSIEELAQAIRAVALGQFVLHPLVARRWASSGRQTVRLHSEVELTCREIEMLRLMSGGATSREIGRQLNLSVNTASNYRTKILTKIGVRNTVQAVAWAIDEGVIGSPDDQAADEAGRPLSAATAGPI